MTRGVPWAATSRADSRPDRTKFDPDRPGTGALEDRWTLGYAFLLSESVEGIVNYTAADDGDDGRFTLRLQVAVN